MINRTKTLVVRRIEEDEFSKCLYEFSLDEVAEKMIANPRWIDYHVYVDKEIQVNIGDVIEYEPSGVNSGYFIKKVTVD